MFRQTVFIFLMDTVNLVPLPAKTLVVLGPDDYLTKAVWISLFWTLPLVSEPPLPPLRPHQLWPLHLVTGSVRGPAAELVHLDVGVVSAGGRGCLPAEV